jgi:2OG-Fe dioxygenase
VPAVSDEPTRTPPGLDRVWAALDRQGYALTDDQAIGLPDTFRKDFRETYFNDSVLRHDPGDLPVDRKRARDVVRYTWRGDDLDLTEHETITITDRADIPGKRDHSRVKLLEDQRGKELLRTLLSLVPAKERQSEGTFGVNLFQTHTNVVSKLHRDDEQYVITYVLDRQGGGAVTDLYESADVTDDGHPTTGAKPVLRHQLNPGEIIIFDDERFRHGATPLETAPGESTRRDALVCTVDYRETYLAATDQS